MVRPQVGSLKRAAFSTARYIFFICTLLALFPTTAFAQQSGITSPATGASVNGALPIFGTAIIEPFQKYELHYKTEPSGDQDYKYFDGDTQQVTNGQLGVLQADGFAPGTYSIRLRVVKQDGNYAEYFAQNISINQVPQATPTALPTVPPPTQPPQPTATLLPPPTLPPSNLPTSTATVVTIGSIGIVTTTPLPREATETPIPTQTFTPAPQPTPAVGQVTQPQVETNILPTRTPLPTFTPIQVAVVVDAPQSNADSSLNAASEDAGSTGAEAAANSAADGGQSAADSTINSETGSAAGSEASGQANSQASGQANSQASGQANSQTNDAAQVAGEAQSTSGSGTSSSITRQLGEALAFDRMRTYFFTGMRYSATIIFLIMLLFVSKRLLNWVRSQV